MPEPTLPVAPVTADDPVKKKNEEEKEKTDGKDALKGKDEKEGEGEELVEGDATFAFGDDAEQDVLDEETRRFEEYVNLPGISYAVWSNISQRKHHSGAP